MADYNRKPKRVAELIHIVPEEKEAYMEKLLNPSTKLSRILWMHGMRNMQYYSLNELIIMSFDYIGEDFYMDMTLMQENPEVRDFLIQTRRRDVPVEEREKTNWWAPMRKEGRILKESPMPDDELEQRILEDYYHNLVSHYREKVQVNASSIAYDAADWKKK
mgnify:FL=1